MRQSGVFYQEYDLSGMISASGNLPAAIVVASKKGIPGKRILCTTAGQYRNRFGNPDPKISFSGYCAVAYLEKGNQLWVVRAIGASATYGCMMLQKKAADATPVLTSLTYKDTGNTFAGPSPAYDFTVGGVSGSVAGEDMVFFYPKGPGSHSKDLRLEIISPNLLPVVGASLVLTPTSNAGVLTTTSGVAGVVSYAVTALNAYGETAATVVKNTTILAANTGVKLTWAAVPGATGYRVYGRTASGGNVPLLATVNSNSYTDTGADWEDTVTVAQPTVSNIPVSNLFTLNLYDDNVSTAAPAETFEVTLLDNVNGLGTQTRIDDVVNTQSELMGCLNYVPSLATAPVVNSTSKVQFATGNSGSLLTDSDVINAWNLFADREQCYVRILINGGFSTPAVQKNMVAIAEKRQDSIAFLDTPSNKQRAVDAVQYRNVDLNVNSNRAAIFAQDLYIQDVYNSRPIYVPPSGHMAALAVNSAYVAAPWYPMAGLTRGQLNVLGVRYKYEEGERELLKMAQVNYVRDFEGQGIALFEQVTMQAKLSGLSWISVRFLLDEIQLAIRYYLLYSVHELNDDFLRRQIVNGIKDFLSNVQRKRGLRRWMVVSDERNNTEQTYGEGKLFVDIFLAPVLPTDQIILRSVLTKGNAVFEELIGTF